MRRIAITGTIGSGKTTVCEYIKDLGIPVFSCDQAALELSQPQTAVYKKMALRFPQTIQNNGEIDRRLLAELVFQNKQARHDLEAILHPAILEKMEAQAACTEGLFLAEVPTLYESGWEQYFDAVLLVCVSQKKRIERLRVNRKMSVEQIQQRQATQWTEMQKRSKATWIIENDGTLDDLRKKTEVWLEDRLSEGG